MNTKKPSLKVLSKAVLRCCFVLNFVFFFSLLSFLVAFVMSKLRQRILLWLSVYTTTILVQTGQMKEERGGEVLELAQSYFMNKITMSTA